MSGKKLLHASVMLICTVLLATPAVAITVSSTTFEGSVYNRILDDSGNEWLSLLATDGLTYGFVSSQIDNAIGDYADYRFATVNEVVALFENYGAPDIDVGATNANFPSATALQNDFGSTGAISIGEPLTWGYTSTILVQGPTSFPSFHLSPFVRVQTSAGEARFQTVLSVSVTADPNTHLRGSWLISTTTMPSIPEPSTAALTALGLVLLGFHAWRRREVVVC